MKLLARKYISRDEYERTHPTDIPPSPFQVNCIWCADEPRSCLCGNLHRSLLKRFLLARRGEG